MGGRQGTPQQARERELSSKIDEKHKEERRKLQVCYGSKMRTSLSCTSSSLLLDEDVPEPNSSKSVSTHELLFSTATSTFSRCMGIRGEDAARVTSSV
ncbi:hypothetical protein F511_30478 [Dorcoceras hygrometricum]|uniref:Uncharacterized protein n=1 Tax=Dorcoceras hygrometricum TaxID=472368 RepID=A0A2Z7BWZ9_9LAMI|nr:hypothetical protein F511_30478 [Dorcoceras hygrometricum]